MSLYLYDDARARAFEPFALTRPAGELRAGALLTRERWQIVVSEAAAGHIVAPHLEAYEEPGAPPAAAGELPAGAIVANSRCIPSLGAIDRGATVWRCAGRVAAVRLGHGVTLESFADGSLPLEKVAADGQVAEIPGRWIDDVWDYIRDLQAQLVEDITALGPTLAVGEARGAHALYVERGATIDPMVSIDCANGPVLVRRHSVVHAFTRLIGPCYVGEHATVTTDRIEGSAIGDHCKVHGELSASIVLGYANKSHDGFVGHSYLGRWVNLGAGTITSNLKNTYGSVQLWTPEGVRDTGMRFLGTLFGDYAKTGIGTRLTTGAVVGAGANVVGGDISPKYVPPFAWDHTRKAATYALIKFYETAERQMSRRAVPLGENAKRQLAAAHARAEAAGSKL